MNIFKDYVHVNSFDESIALAEINGADDPDWTYTVRPYNVAKHPGAESISHNAFESDEYYVVEVRDEDGLELGTL
jgi:hypothetical protein